MQYKRETVLPCSAAEAFRWHGREGAFERLSPPWNQIEVLSRKGDGIELGSEIEIALKKGGIGSRWLARISDYAEGALFEDTQVKGPFTHWKHRHEFLDIEASACRLSDVIEYELPGKALGRWVAGRYAQSELRRVFHYRHAITRSDLETWTRFRSKKRLDILISGGYGFIGKRLGDFLRSQGHRVSALSRSPKSGDVGWDPVAGTIDTDRLEGFDAVVHLAGENLASGRWNERRKRSLWKSRVDATQFLVGALAKLSSPPKTMICASGIGYYGDRGDRIMTESESLGSGFLAELCAAWESAAEQSLRFAERVIRLRTGIVLDPAGGALQKMLLPFELGLGGRLGSGRQWMPWISIEDWIGSAYHLLMGEAEGPFNLVAPNPAPNEAFAKSLGKAIGRPAIFPVPSTVLKALVGEFAEAGLLSSCRALPDRLTASGYAFRYPDLGSALALSLGREKAHCATLKKA